jgi:hypothetical protein
VVALVLVRYLSESEKDFRQKLDRHREQAAASP